MCCQVFFREIRLEYLHPHLIVWFGLASTKQWPHRTFYICLVMAASNWEYCIMLTLLHKWQAIDWICFRSTSCYGAWHYSLSRLRQSRCLYSHCTLSYTEQHVNVIFIASAVLQFVLHLKIKLVVSRCRYVFALQAKIRPVRQRTVSSARRFPSNPHQVGIVIQSSDISRASECASKSLPRPWVHLSICMQAPRKTRCKSNLTTRRLWWQATPLLVIFHNKWLNSA